MSRSQKFGECFGFNEIFQSEIDLINQRRAKHRTDNPSDGPLHPEIALTNKIKRVDEDALHPDVVTIEELTDSTDTPVLFPQPDANLTGLALSGGGVRSAAFCLGALQALDEAGVLDRVDYLSTVSGGGYVGCSLTAALETYHAFPFAIDDVEDETPSMQHIRDYSNYLFPHGASDFLQNAAVCVRGLVANAILVLPFLLIAAALTILAYARYQNPDITSAPPLAGGNFVVTVYLLLFLLLSTIIWGVMRSVPAFQKGIDAPSLIARGLGLVAIGALVAAFFEAQPILLGLLASPEELNKRLLEPINQLTAILAPFAAVIAFFAGKLGEYLKSATESKTVTSRLARLVANAAIYLAALVVPLLLWVAYLNLAHWGICNDVQPCIPHWVPDWMLKLPPSLITHATVWVYVLAALVLIGITLLLRPNANSLHPLYRDRLGKAFLFKPKARVPIHQPLTPTRQSLEELPIQLADLTGLHGPYHLINAALNIQGSKTANKRGRNADFFLLSPKFIGSESTRYVATADYKSIHMGVSLATAMAVSGAAASSNMGAQSIKPLTPTLALLNIRLGYWMRNPAMVHQATPGKPAPWNRVANFYFFLELLGLLDEKKKSVYLTDGGHIENLGIYELLKRNCRVIIAVDAEADPEMAFGSFNTLVRFARIDLGIEIDLPWQQLTNRTKETNSEIEKTGDAEKHRGPHCAIGRIVYSWNNGRPDRTGILVYIKSSLTGDENDYVYHYKKRYWAFPHETTLDQMFSEEQFEAYRALGYHATNGFFSRRDDFAKIDDMGAMLDDVTVLDALFPRSKIGRPGEKREFADWLRSGRTEATTDDE